MMFSVDRKRYDLPNIPVTEQKEQSNGQPREVWMGMVRSDRARPESGLSREKSE